MPLSECFDYRAASFWLKLQFPFSSFCCSEYDGGALLAKTPRRVMFVSEWHVGTEILGFPVNKNPEQCYCWNHFYDFSFFLALSQFFSHLTFDIYFAFWMFIWLFFLPLMRERRICHCFSFNPLAQVFPPFLFQPSFLILSSSVFCSPPQWSDQ